MLHRWQQQHQSGTLKATDAQKLAEEKEKAEKKALRIKELKELKKACPVSFNVMKSQCNKKGCEGDKGELLKII